MRLCSVEGCTKRHYGKGLCQMHWARQRKAEAPPCTVSGCEKLSHARGLCRMHYLRLLRHGDVHANYRLQKRFKECQVPGCSRETRAHGICDKHYHWCRHKGLEFGAEAIRDYELEQARATLARYGVPA